VLRNRRAELLELLANNGDWDGKRRRGAARVADVNMVEISRLKIVMRLTRRWDKGKGVGWHWSLG
jgi:hypothetical protein